MADMTEKMTLEQVRDWLRARAQDGPMQRSVFTPGSELRQMADAIDAHLAGMGEPVAWMRTGATQPDPYVITSGIRALWRAANPQHVERYTIPLFAAPPASGDWDAVREVIANLDNAGDTEGTATLLRAALPEAKS